MEHDYFDINRFIFRIDIDIDTLKIHQNFGHCYQFFGEWITKILVIDLS